MVWGSVLKPRYKYRDEAYVCMYTHEQVYSMYRRSGDLELVVYLNVVSSACFNMDKLNVQYTVISIWARVSRWSGKRQV